MVRAPGVHVPRSEAEDTRRRLAEADTLRTDLHVLHTEEGIAFPVTDDEGSDDAFDFRPRLNRPRKYTELLDWSQHELDLAPRAFEAMGDIGVVKVPDALWERREALGRALALFLGARAVFHDRGVKGTFRVRDLERIHGEGGSATVVQENGVRLHVDVGAAYFSPRLADERARMAGLVVPGEHLVDLFGGVAPLGVQAAKAGARVTSVDLNPAAVDLAHRNATENGVEMALHCGDARAVAPTLAPADRVVMNLPHGARDFLDVALALVRPGGWIHLHEILPDAEVAGRRAALAAVGRVETVRHVRNYSAADSHVCFDIQAGPA